MYCPSCGEETPDQSTFCMHCGNTIAAPGVVPPPARQAPIAWEYHEFAYEFPPGGIWVNVGREGYTMPDARATFWQEYQREIISELQQWLDEGWEPVGEVGPSSIEVRTYQGIKMNAFGWLVVLAFSIFLLGLPLLWVRDEYAEPTAFRLQMRAPKGTKVPQVP